MLAPALPANGQMLLEANTLIYDNDRKTVTAEGGVQIDYAGNRMVAHSVTYDQKSGRLIARGNVELVDGQGTKIFSDEIDVTDDFKDGFVNALRVETADKTYFGAESATRQNGNVTIFNSGVYTACKPCEEKPGKPPIWRVKARKIIWNGEAKTLRFERARFELFGLPIIYLPYFETADPTVKRKSGFLMPGVHYKTELGYGVSIPYYLALSPTYDAMVTGTYYSKQGFLGQAEWRQRFDNGQYSVQIAGINQQNRRAFSSAYLDSTKTSRGMIATKGDFRINPRWSFGWDILAQSDRNFSRTYTIGNYQDVVERSEIYLTGLNDRNYFDMRAYRFHVQDAAVNPIYSRDPKQPWVLPSLDYTKTVDTPGFGGQLRLDVNAQALYRNDADFTLARPAVRGIEGQSGRLTAEAEWKRQIVAPGGLVLTPLLHARADGIYADPSASSAAAITAMGGLLTGQAYSHNGAAYGPVSADLRSSYFRPMVTAGLEARWPILVSTPGSSHVFEPMAQVFARPNAAYEARLGIPNEDAQSFVFDATTLFERDKFSGYDRVEGGVRANLGLRYSGSFNNGWGANALFGQSYHLAGANPFASPDLVNVGAFSGLETDVSDYVGLVGLNSPGGLSLAAAGRFDEETLEVRRAEVRAGVTLGTTSLTTNYAFIQKQPLYGFTEDRKEVTVGARTKFNENWGAFGSGTYDLQSNMLVRNSVGFSYDDECFNYSMTYSEIRTVPLPGIKSARTQSIGFNISFRTIGDFGSDTNAIGQ